MSESSLKLLAEFLQEYRVVINNANYTNIVLYNHKKQLLIHSSKVNPDFPEYMSRIDRLEYLALHSPISLQYTYEIHIVITTVNKNNLKTIISCRVTNKGIFTRKNTYIPHNY